MSAAPAERPCHVLFVIAGLGAGGAERVVSLISSAWVARGWRVTIMAFDRPQDPVYHRFDPAVEIRRFDIPPGRNPASTLMAQGRRILAIRRQLKDARPDVVISLLTKINVLTLTAAIGTGRKIIVSERNNPRAQNANSAWNALLAQLYPRAAGIVMQTRASLDCLPQSARSLARVIHNPIEAIAPPASAAGVQRVLVGVGRLTHQKGFDLLIEAFAKVARLHPDWILRIWGEGEMRGMLERQVASLGLSHRIELPGKSETPGGWLAKADAMVLSSRYEGFANVLGEAMAAGLPVVAFNCDFGPAEMVDNLVDGLLVPDGDAGALAAALDRIMGDAALRMRLGIAARQSATRFASPAIIEQWDRLVDDVRAVAGA